MPPSSQQGVLLTSSQRFLRASGPARALWAGLGGLVLSGLGSPGALATPALNDTGYTRCVVNGQFTSQCAGTGQDAEYGRDATAPDGRDGVAGFSFTKVCGSGEVAGQGNCPADPARGTGANEWACTLDNVTHLLWQLDVGTRVTHYPTGPYNYRDYVKQVNASGLCGHSDWHLPATAQLETLVLSTTGYPAPAIDTAWFPSTPSSQPYWAMEARIDNPQEYWVVMFDMGGMVYPLNRQYKAYVRLVHQNP